MFCTPNAGRKEFFFECKDFNLEYTVEAIRIHFEGKLTEYAMKNLLKEFVSMTSSLLGSELRHDNFSQYTVPADLVNEFCVNKYKSLKHFIVKRLVDLKILNPEVSTLRRESEVEEKPTPPPQSHLISIQEENEDQNPKTPLTIEDTPSATPVETGAGQSAVGSRDRPSPLHEVA